MFHVLKSSKSQNVIGGHFISFIYLFHLFIFILEGVRWAAVQQHVQQSQLGDEQYQW